MAAEVSSFKMLLTLGLAGMISGGVLVGIYEATAPLPSVAVHLQFRPMYIWLRSTEAISIRLQG